MLKKYMKDLSLSLLNLSCISSACPGTYCVSGAVLSDKALMELVTLFGKIGQKMVSLPG